MKNPRVALTFAELQSPAMALNPPLAAGRPAAMGLLPIADKTGSGFDDVLTFFKFSDADIKDLDQISNSTRKTPTVRSSATRTSRSATSIRSNSATGSSSTCGCTRP
jgi:hypothetical protein